MTTSDIHDELSERLRALLASTTDPRGLRIGELLAALDADPWTRHRIKRALTLLIDAGHVLRAPGARYRSADWRPPVPLAPSYRTPAPVAIPPGSVVGRLIVHPAGFAFLEREDGEESAYVSARHRGGAMDHDRVAAAVWPGPRGFEGRVLAVLSRGRPRVTGVLAQRGRALVLLPDDTRLRGPVLLEGEPPADAVVGEVAVAEITAYPEVPHEPMVARLLRMLGAFEDPRTELAKILACEEVEERFPPDVEAEAARVPDHVLPSDIADRTDLRRIEFLTIDPETARDFDDAVCVEPGPAGRSRLWVAVADVSHYVPVGSALDREAERRAFSVYLPDRAVPMLPPALSSGICSLNPAVDRLAMVTRLDIDEHGAVHDPWFGPAVIRSRARLDYAGAARALAGEPSERERPYLEALERVQAVAARIRARRTVRGALDFELPEAVVKLEGGDPRRVLSVERARSEPMLRATYGLIEDCMLAANEAVAAYFERRDQKTLWRIHAPPRKEALERFAATAESLGIAFDPTDASPVAVRRFLHSMRGRPQERVVSYLLLRSLKQAAYAVDNVGHFGLAAPAYLHFTSPIRRYPDLVVHRMLKALLRGESSKADGGSLPPVETLREWALGSSRRERRVQDVERAVLELYRALLMREHLGEEFDGTITGMSSAGLFVELDSPFVDGLLPGASLGDEVALDESGLYLRVPRSGQMFALGDRLRVRVENVSLPRRRVEFALVRRGERAAAGAAKKPKKSAAPRPPARPARPAKATARRPSSSPRSRGRSPSRGRR